MRADTNDSTSDPGPRFHFIGGKGGVGKTTCAAAFAVRAASDGDRVLVASTDPAPSLGDALARPLSRSPRAIPVTRGKLSAVEIDAPPVLKRWIADRRPLLEKIALQGTWLDREDVSRLLGLSLPGIDEVAALLEIARLSRGHRYDLIVVDTAPTGHTLRMLSMPETLFAVARVFDQMRRKHRVMVETLRGAWTPEPEDDLVYSIAGEAKALASMLRDPARTRMSWVTLPEPMAVAETVDALAALRDREIPVTEVIVNRLTPVPPTRCGHCDARRAFEVRAMQALPSDVPTLRVSTQDAEPRGLPALKRIAGELDEPAAAGALKPSTGRQATWKAAMTGKRVRMDGVFPESARLVLFGGKGGVGKTTCAAAAAIGAAEAAPDKRVLLISIDPAHSLGDVFGAALSDDPQTLRGAPANLVLRELNAGLVFEDVRRKYAAAIDEIFARFGAGAGHDRSVMHGIIDLAPPGLDELASVIEIMDSVSGPDAAWDLVVIDTAPTGHALRLLETPTLIRDWTKALMSILLKYQSVTGVGELGSLLLKLSRGLGRLHEALSNPEETAFVVVTRAAALPRAESTRLVARLQKLDVAVPAVIVNAVGRGTCARCRAASAAEARELAALRRAVAPRGSRRVVLTTGVRIPGPAGPAQLREWRRDAWRV